MVEQTNVYAHQTYQSSTPPKTPWRDVTIEEMLACLGMNIAMGIVNLPEVNMYWSTDPLLEHPWFRTILSRNRFKQILRFLHLNDNTKQALNKDDKLFKVRPFVDILLNSFKTHFSPKRNLSLDESMIGTKCRLSFRVYIKNKPIYTGYVDLPDDGNGATYHVVMRLLEDYLDQGHCVFMDNYYTSPTLFNDLLLRNTDAVGTCTAGRINFPKLYFNSFRLKKGESAFVKQGDITACKFFEKREVHLLSTCHTNATTTVRRRGSSQDLTVPLMVHHYNGYMGGVDVADQYMVYYAIGRKAMKWYRRVIWRLIEMAIINSFVIYRSHQPMDSRVRQLKYRMDLANALITPLIEKRNATLRPVTRSPTVPERLLGKHFPYKNEVRGRCRVCGNKREVGKKKGRRDTNGIVHVLHQDMEAVTSSHNSHVIIQSLCERKVIINSLIKQLSETTVVLSM